MDTYVKGILSEEEILRLQTLTIDVPCEVGGDSCKEWIDVDLTKLPKGVVKLRFINSWEKQGNEDHNAG